MSGVRARNPPAAVADATLVGVNFAGCGCVSGLRGVSGAAWVWGSVLGCAIAGVDLLMAVVSTSLLTFCFNFVVSCVLYSLGGYLAGSLTDRRRQGMLAGLVAAVLVAVAGTLALQLVPQWRIEGWGLLGAAVFNLGFNAPLGAVFGYLGGSIGAKQE